MESPSPPSLVSLKSVLVSVIHSGQHSERIGIFVWTLFMVSPFAAHSTFLHCSYFSECELADFVTGSSTEKIPFVFLPLSGQLVYPRWLNQNTWWLLLNIALMWMICFSASIIIPPGQYDPSLVSPICVVSTVDIMTNNGLEDITNFIQEYQQPFQLYSDNGKTYLQV